MNAHNKITKKPVGFSRFEHAEIAAVAMLDCHPDNRCAIAKKVLRDHGYRAGPPPVPFDDVIGEAGIWAASASPDELNAYAVAAFNEMKPDRKTGFKCFVCSGVAS